MKRTSKRTYALAVIIAAIVLLITSIAGGGANFARAATSAPSDVLDDLRKDSSFNLSDYPINEKDYSLQVIQIAESTDGELLVYVYQPSGQAKDLRASSINIARNKNNTSDLSFTNYKLTFLNSTGVFYKYKVDNFKLSEDTVRYYNVSNILRPHSYLLDGTLSGGNKEAEVKNEVGKLFSAVTVNGGVQYNCIESEVIVIENKYVGHMTLPQGVKLKPDLSYEGRNTIRNFVAFSTDKPIDRLIEVELQYDLQSVYYHICLNTLGVCSEHGTGEAFGYKYGDKVTQEPITLRADDAQDASHKYGHGGRNFTWDKIQRTSDFLADCDRDGSDYVLTNNATKEQLSNTQWLLNFYNADWVMTHDTAFDYHTDVNTERVSGVIILRLMFEANGDTYNLGVVDNKQTGSSSPAVVGKPKTVGDDIKDFFKNLGNKISSFFKNLFGGVKWWQWLLIGIAIIIVIFIVLFIVFPSFRKTITKAHKRHKNTSNKNRSKSKPRKKAGKKK